MPKGKMIDFVALKKLESIDPEGETLRQIIKIFRKDAPAIIRKIRDAEKKGRL
jgi:hypothetical protein